MPLPGWKRRGRLDAAACLGLQDVCPVTTGRDAGHASDNATVWGKAKPARFGC